MKSEPNRTTIIGLFFLLTLLATTLIITPAAIGGDYPWKNHAKPYDFTL